MLGVDAASEELIRTNLCRLPNFRRALETGHYKPMHSWGDVVPGSVWPSFATGQGPGEHGIYHHIQWDPAAMRLRRVSADWLGYSPFWLDIAAQQKNVCIVDVPMSFPTLPATALEIVSWASHDKLVPFYCNRPEIDIELRRHFGTSPMGAEIPVAKSSNTLKGICRKLVTSADQKGKFLQKLVNYEDWDLFIAVFGETHRGGHLLWSSDDLIDVYEAVDRSLGLVWQSTNTLNTSLIVFSVHGMARDISRNHVVPFVVDCLNRSYHEEFNTGPTPHQRSLTKTLRRVVPAPIQHAVAQIAPVWLRDFVVQQAASGGHDWSRTPGLALLADLSGYIRLNLEGRESRGILPCDNAETHAYTDMIRSYFGELVDVESNQKIVSDIIPRADLFRGGKAELLPDLFITWDGNSGSGRVSSNRLGVVRSGPTTGRSGNHTANGFAIILPCGDELGGLPHVTSITGLSNLVRAMLSSREMH